MLNILISNILRGALVSVSASKGFETGQMARIFSKEHKIHGSYGGNEKWQGQACMSGTCQVLVNESYQNYTWISKI